MHEVISGGRATRLLPDRPVLLHEQECSDGSVLMLAWCQDHGAAWREFSIEIEPQDRTPEHIEACRARMRQMYLDHRGQEH